MVDDYRKSSSQSVNIICREAVRHSFVSHLSAALRRQGIFASVFADSVSDDQIQGARVTVVVFSDSYTFASPWFDKFRKLLELRRNNRHEVISVLYGGNPLLLLETGGHQSGSLFIGMNNSSNMMIHTDSELVEEIVRDVYGKLFPTERIGIYSRLLKIENLLCDQPWDVRSLGIWGMPGIGKTTLAKAVFDQMSNDYDASCFIDNFDEALHKEGPHRLLQEKIGKTLKEKFGVSTSYITRLSLLKDKLCDTRILVVLDDVRNPLVAESFLGRLDWLGPGSLIIITSRYKQVFALCQISQIYEVQGLNEHEALHLFSQIAFEKNVPEQNDKQLSVKVIAYANGNPLALRIYGQELKRKESEMEAAFLELKQCPPQLILDGLKSVCSALGDNEKYIFLDIACFFKGENVDYVVQLLKGCGYFPRVGIDILVEKCLVTISENTLQMNDLIQDIVREIFVREKMHMESCRTLWQPSSIRYLLEDDELKADGEPKETPKCLLVAEDVQGISLDTSNLCFNVNPDAFTKIVCLRFLKVYNSYSENVPGLNFPKGLNSLPHALRLLHWENYPFESLPQGFDLRNLVELNMPYSQLKILGSRTKNLEMLKRIRLCHSQQLVECDILLYAQNMELLDLQGCTGLKSFPDMSELQHLRVLNLSGCTGIKSFRGASPNIEELHLQGTSITEIPSSTVIHSPRVKLDRKKLFNFLENSPDVEPIDLECLTNLVKVASYNKGLGKLVRLNIKDCYHLQSLPDMVNLESLEVLHLSGCTYLEEIKGFPRNMKELYIGGTAIRQVPQLPRCLELLNAHGCKHLELIRFDFERLPRHYTFSNCFSLSSQVIYEFLEEGLTRVAKLSSEQQQELRKAPAVKICIPVDGRHKSSFPFRAGPNVMVELTPCTRKALSGFAMSIVVSFRDDYHNIVGLGIRCICTWTSRNGHSNKIERVFQCWAPMEAPKVECDHMFVFYDTGMHLSAGEENDPSISDDEIKFEFHTVSGENKLLGANCSVLECDVQVITAPTSDTSVGGITRQCEATSIIEEDTPPLPKEPEASQATSWLSSSEPRKDSSMPSTVRSKENVFGKWLGCFPWVSMPPKKLKVRTRRTRSLEEALEEAKKAAFEQALKIAALQKALFEKAAVEESKEKGTRKQLDDDQAEDKGQIKQSKDLTEEDVKLPPSICNGCNSAIEDGISVDFVGAAWHPQCFCCLHCHKPIATHEIPDLKGKFHKSCYKGKFHPKCYVCKKKIPSTEKGIKYNEHSFWKEKYCASHDVDGTARCSSCERLEPWGTKYVMLTDGRWLCLECLESDSIMNTYECVTLHNEIREFFQGLNMKVEKEFPLLLVEKEALAKAEKEEKIDYHHAVEIRSLCLSEEQTVTSVSRSPRMGPNGNLIGMVTESQTVSGSEVTAILIIYGFPMLLTGYILAREMMHAWLKLNGYININIELKEGLCQLIALIWLDSQTYATSDAFSSASASTSNKSDQSDFRKKLVEFYKYQIETDDSPYGLGLKKVNKIMVSNHYNLKDTLKDIVSASKTRPGLKF